MAPSPDYCIDIYQQHRSISSSLPIIGLMEAQPSNRRPLPGDLYLLKLPVDLVLEQNESISTLATYKSSIYVGTTKGQILHLHCFEDASEYLHILQLQVTEKDVLVTKILPLPDVELCLVICNRTMYVYTLPELLPCHMGKIRDVNDVLELSQVKNPRAKNIHDKVIVFTSTRLRVVQFVPPETVKLLRDIPYMGALMGISSAAGTLANYSNICLVANGENYDVVDLQQTRRIPLFEHNPEKAPGIAPNILPFDAEDSEEYLLSVRTNESTSMAMFINSFGDVTRGTMTWIDVGYPTNGMAVVWPHVIGLFSVNGSLSLTFSSLESLEVVEATKVALLFDGNAWGEVGNLMIQGLKHPVFFCHEQILDWLTKTNIESEGDRYISLQSANVVLHNDKNLYYMYQESTTYTKLQAILKGLQTTDSAWELSIKDLEGETGVLRLIHVILLLATGKITDVEDKLIVGIDPRVLLYLIGDLGLGKEIYEGFYLEKAVWFVLNHFRPLQVEESFKEAFIKSTYDLGEVEGALFKSLRVMMYQRLRSARQAIEMVASEKEKALWVSNESTNLNILDVLDNKDWNTVKLEVLLLRQTHEKASSTTNELSQEITDELAQEITSLAFKLLDKKIDIGNLEISDDGVATQDGYSIDLVEVILTQLKENFDNSEMYNRNLLELLKLQPQRGLAFLEANKFGKHKATHKHILEEYSKLHNLDAGFSSLKLEFVEQSLIDHVKETGDFDPRLAKELLNEQLEYLEMQRGEFANDYVNLDILLTSFKHEYDLANGRVPQIYWIDYLGIHGKRSECQQLASFYVKIYELLLLLRLHREDVPPLPSEGSESMQHLDCLFSGRPVDEIIDESITRADQMTSNWVAEYGMPPTPKKLVYFSSLTLKIKSLYSKRENNDIISSIKLMLERYLRFEQPLSRYEAIKFLVTSFGKKCFSPVEVLQLIPPDLPLAFIYDYLKTVMVSNESDKIESDLIRILARLDSKLMSNVVDDLKKDLQKYSGEVKSSEP